LIFSIASSAAWDPGTPAIENSPVKLQIAPIRIGSVELSSTASVASSGTEVVCAGVLGEQPKTNVAIRIQVKMDIPFETERFISGSFLF
jgi:hypothetical protein